MAKKQELCSKGHDFSVTRKTHPNGDTYCSECKKIRTKKSQKENAKKHSEYSWKSRIKRFYGLKDYEYASLYLEQNGCCAICNVSIEYISRQTHIDHDHQTLKVRGLLCHHCNTGLGLFKENTEVLINAISYLNKHKEINDVTDES